MTKNSHKSMGFTIIAAVSIIGFGIASTTPTAFAATDQNKSAIGYNEDQNNLLSKLEIKGIPLDETLSPDRFDYSGTVENNIDQITLTVESNQPNAVITVNGQTPKNIEPNTYSLVTGENKFIISVNDGIHPPRTYTLTVTRKLNNDNTLKSLTLSKGELAPKFSPNITDYHVQVTNNIDRITLSAEAGEETSQIKVQNTILRDNSEIINLPVGKMDISLFVTAENGDKKTYIIHVMRAPKPNSHIPAPLKGHGKNSKGKANNQGSSGKQGYPHGSKGSKPQGSFQGHGSKSKGSLQSTHGSKSQGLQVAKTSKLKSPSKRAGAAPVKISTANLSSLTVSAGKWASDFSSEKYTYFIQLPSGLNSITINPVSQYSSASVLMNGNTNKTIQLTGTRTVIPVLVTRGQDRKTYVLVFDKPTPTVVVAKTESTQQTSDSTPNLNTKTPSITPKLLSASKTNTNENKASDSFIEMIIAFFKKIF